MKRFGKAMAALGLALAMGATFAPSAGAAHLEANEAADTCRQLDEQGTLDVIGITRGECVNSFKTPGSENASSNIAAQCGHEFLQSDTGTTNKGQCIQALRVLGY